MQNRFVAIILFIACNIVCAGQSTFSGKITGVNSGKIANATIALLNTSFYAVSDSAGYFSFSKIAAGTYIVSITAAGYVPLNEKIVVKTVGDQPRVFQLAGAGTQLEEIIVTAQKQEENAQKISLSISALSKKEIDQFHLWESKDLSAIIPNLFAGNPGDGRNVIALRGITSSSYDPAITTYIDGVSQFTLDTYIPQLFDVARIEILRGPQGTLYGRNSMGGVINIITKQPTGKTEGFAEISAGNYGLARYSAGIKTPVIKQKLFFGAALLYEAMGGFYTNTFTQSRFDRQHRIAGNYYLKYIPSSKWTLAFNVKQVANRNAGAFPLAGNTAEAFSTPFRVNQNAVGKMIDNTINSSLSVNYSAKRLTVSSQTAYQSNYRYYQQPIDGDFSPIDGVTLINDYGHPWNRVQVGTQEFKVASVSSPLKLKWVAGALLFYQKAPNKQATHFGKDAALVGSPDTNYAIINTTTLINHGVSLYTQASYPLTDKIDITAGLRYDFQHSREQVQGDYKPDSAATPIFQTQPDTSAKASYGAFSPKLAIAYHPSGNINAYASYSRGYRTGGLTQLSADPSQPPLFAYKPEYSNNFEIGSKNMFFKNTLRVNISLFYTTITDVQVPTLVLPQAITVTKNAGHLKSKGFETELAASVTKHFEIDYNFGYTYAKYSSLKLSQNGTTADLSGNYQVFTPDVTSMMALQYRIWLTRSHAVKLIADANWTYLGKTYFDFSNSIRQSPYSLFNAIIRIAVKHFEFSVWGKNLLDKKYISYAYDFGAVHLGDPQTIGATVRATL